MKGIDTKVRLFVTDLQKLCKEHGFELKTANEAYPCWINEVSTAKPVATFIEIESEYFDVLSWEESKDAYGYQG